MKPPRSITVFTRRNPAQTAAALERVVDLAVEGGIEVRIPAEEVEKHGLAERSGTVLGAEQQFEEPWTIERLARTVGLNERDLKAGFRRLVGRSIHAHLRNVRLEAAASMLRDGRTVTDAALAAGFGNLSHFSKTFRESKGVAPREYARLPRFTKAGAAPGGPIDR